MHSRKKSRTADATIGARTADATGAAHSPSTAPVPAESATRIKRAAPQAEDLHESVQASLDAALDDLDRLELTFEDAARTPPEPAQRMPKGMPPLPFKAPLPSKMPPLPRSADAPAPIGKKRPR